MSNFRPGEVVELKGKLFKVAACNYEGKIILHPIGSKETISDMAMRLQSTVACEPEQK